VISDTNPPYFISFEDKLIYEQPNSSTLDVRATERVNLMQQLEEKNRLIALQKEQIRVMEKALKEQNIDISSLLITLEGHIPKPPGESKSLVDSADNHIAANKVDNTTDVSPLDSFYFRKNVDLLVDLMEATSDKGENSNNNNNSDNGESDNSDVEKT